VHSEARERWAVVVASGTVRCRRCGEFISGSEGWDLGHGDVPGEESRPEHVICNRSHGAALGHALVAERSQQRLLIDAAQDPRFADRPGRYFGPPGVNDSRPLPWSRQWLPWRDDALGR
jgi:hypothetical protein